MWTYKAAEKFKAPETSTTSSKEVEQEAAAAEGGEESEGEEVSVLVSVMLFADECSL